jgi:PEP-CTERM motif
MKTMKLKSLLVAGVVLATAVAASATVTLNVGAEVLFQSDGTTPIPAGSLIQLLASTTDSVFTAPTPSSFIGGSADDVILESFAAPDNSGFAGDDIVVTLSGNLNAGDPLLLRWWPTLTLASSTPGAGTPYGQFRTDVTENFSDSGWFIPSDGSVISLNFLDESSGIAPNPEPDSAGTASFVVVPEPSTFALGALGALGLVLVRRRSIKR